MIDNKNKAPTVPRLSKSTKKRQKGQNNGVKTPFWYLEGLSRPFIHPNFNIGIYVHMFYQLLGWLVLASRVCRCWNQSPELREHCDFQWRLGSPPQGSAQRLQRRQRCHGFIEDCRHDQWDHWSAGRGIESGRQGGCSGDADDEETKVSQAGKKNLSWKSTSEPSRTLLDVLSPSPCWAEFSENAAALGGNCCPKDASWKQRQIFVDLVRLKDCWRVGV